jgi:redox-sensitive bicupin YhaK (pirin superfamily)
MHFGMLRVLNDDFVIGGAGFGKHGHENMEIISIPLQGSLAHADSTGNEGIIKPGDIQIMSAGSGIMHSEYNGSEDETLNFLQLWIYPHMRNIAPRYDQRAFEQEELRNAFKMIVSDDQQADALWINQDARLYLGEFSETKEIVHALKSSHYGLYIFIIEGTVKIGDMQLDKRDGYGINDVESVLMHIQQESKILLIEVPMKS